MTVSTQVSREADRVGRRTKTQSDEALRAAAQRHKDARQQRLEAYVESLRVAVGENPSSEHSARLASRLAQAHRDAEGAARRRVPRVGTTSRSLAALALTTQSTGGRPPGDGPAV